MATGDELRNELRVLDEFEQERLKRSAEEREADRAKGVARGEQLFGEGALGRLSEATDPAVMDLVTQRQQAISDLQGSNVSADRRAELERVTQDFDRLIAERTDPNNPANIAARENAIRGIDRQTSQNLRRIASLSNESGTRLSQGLVNDALQQAQQQRRELEQQLLISGQQAKEDLTAQGAAARSSSIAELDRLEAAKRADIESAQRRLEDLQGAIQQDVLNRQTYNIEARRQELFGKLSTEESTVAQGIAERVGERQQLLAQASAIDQRNYQAEALDIQRIEAEKPPPSGGKWLCGAHAELGYIGPEVLKADQEYGYLTVDDDAKRGYAVWAFPVSEFILRHPWIATFTGPFVSAWANEMAHRHGCEQAKANMLGKAMIAVCTPVCRALGKALKWAGWDVPRELKVAAQFREID